MNYSTVSIALAALLSFGSVSLASPPGVVKKEYLEEDTTFSPFVGNDYPNQVLFGDTHFHTNLSIDAGLVGTSLGVDEAVRCARGEKVISNTGQPVQLVRPLDFLVITDHAEFLGIATMLQNSDPLLLSDPWGARIYKMFNAGQEQRMKAFGKIIDAALVQGVNPFESDEAARSVWSKHIRKIDSYNDPGTFTVMSGFEWTSSPNGNNLHRCVIFADSAEKTSQILPFGLFDGVRPDDLWKYLEAYEEKTGGRVLAIPHNGNLSNGMMWATEDSNGNKLTKAYAEARMRWEPLYEMTQMKGDEEAHPLLSPDDEFADFENWDVVNVGGSAAKTDEMLPYEYARSALKLGLKLGKELGANPFKFGMIGASDTHTALATTREENYFGKFQHTEPSNDRFDGAVLPTEDPKLQILTSQEGASGLHAVWTRENTRDAIFDAMRRKEAYATTGTRIQVRLFAGWDFEPSEVDRPDFAAEGYRRGVPMGGDLRLPEGGANGASPKFMIRALRDADGANLDRVQVIKGWIDAGGKTHERIYDVALSDGRKAGDDGRCKTPVGSTVDIKKATYTNSIGAVLLAAHWEDPDFDPAESAFYYVRVLEIPTPRWTTYDAVRFGVKPPTIVPATVQDRAYTSPVWYTPKG